MAARPDGDWAVECSALVKDFGDIHAVRGIDLQVPRGQTFGFLGPNGAGKSTTISILCTLLPPTSGSARVAGHDVVAERDDVRRHIGLVFQEPTVDVYLSAAQNLRFHAELYGVPRSLVGPRMRQVLDLVGLWDRRDHLVQTYSGGMKRRLEIARGLMHSPMVLFLDEPTIGLDPQTRASIWEYLHALREREEISVFLTTHYMEEADNCDSIAIIDRGVIVANGSPADLKAAVGADQVRISTVDNPRAVQVLRDRFGVEPVLRDGLVAIAVPDGERFVPRLFSGLGVEITSVSLSRPSLDDVFLSYTGRSIRDEDHEPEQSVAAAFPWRGR